jgi:hypothetical protein
MRQRELYRQISQATGESLATIAGMGFSLQPSAEAEPEPQVIDWDEQDTARGLCLVPQRRPSVARA